MRRLFCYLFLVAAVQAAPPPLKLEVNSTGNINLGFSLGNTQLIDIQSGATFTLSSGATWNFFGSAITNASTARTAFGLAIGTNVQAYDADLTTWAGVTPSANGQSFVSAANYNAMKALLDLEIGTDVQAYDADLDDLADGSLSGSKVGSGIAGANITSGVVGTGNGGTGATSLSNLIALSTHTTGNYVATAVGATGQIDVAGSGSEGAGLTISLAGEIDLGSKLSLEIPNGAAPTTDAAGELALDTTITDHQALLQYSTGSDEMLAIAIPRAQLTTTDGHVIKYSAANDRFEMGAVSGGVSDGDKGDITVSSSGAAFTIDNGVVTAAKTSITGTPTGAKFLRDDWTWADAGGAGTEYVRLLSAPGGGASVFSDALVDTPAYEGQLGLAWPGNHDFGLMIASGTGEGDWFGALSIPGGIVTIGEPGYASANSMMMHINLAANPTNWDASGEALLSIMNHSGDDHSSGSGINLAVTRLGYGVTAAAVDDDGSSYVVGDLLTVAGGTLSAISQATILRVTGVSSGNITSVVVHNVGEYVTAPSNPVSVTGGSGSGATFDLTTATKAVRAMVDNAASIMHVGDYAIDSLLPNWNIFVMNVDEDYNKGWMFSAPSLTGIDNGNYSWMVLDGLTGLVRFPHHVAGKYEPEDAGWKDTMTIDPALGVVRVQGSFRQRDATDTSDVIQTDTSGNLTLTGELRDGSGSGVRMKMLNGGVGGMLDLQHTSGAGSIATIDKTNGLALPISGQKIQLGAAGVIFSEDNDGAFTIAGNGNGSDENFTVNLDDTANTGVWSSSTGLNKFTFTSIDLEVPTEAYDRSGWNGDNTVPTKDAVSDKIEALPYQQGVYASTATTDSTATTIPLDDTLPQSNEGDEAVTVTITPKSASSKIRITGVAMVARSTGSTAVCALFRDSATDAAAVFPGFVTTASPCAIPVFFEEASPGTSAVTYKLRYGSSSGTTYLNQSSTGRVYGGAAITWLHAEEIF